MFGYNAQFKRCTINGAKTLRVQRLSATTGVKQKTGNKMKAYNLKRKKLSFFLSLFLPVKVPVLNSGLLPTYKSFPTTFDLTQ